MADLDAMVEKYRQSLPSDYPGYVGHVRRFVAFCKGDLSRRTIDRFLEHMKEEGYADGTVDLAFRVLRRFYIVNGLEWPYRRGEGPVVREREVYAPALDPSLVAELIAVAVAGKLDAEETGCLALSTVYGLRRTEMAALTPSDLRLDQGLLFVETAKHGRQRWHLIPSEIWEPLSNLKEKLPLGSPMRITNIWYRIEEKTGLAEIRQERKARGETWEIGWHSIRRALDHLLIDAGLPVPLVSDFLRWKRSGSFMPARYYSVPFVGRETSVHLGGEDKRTDETVFQYHPFLRWWRKEKR